MSVIQTIRDRGALISAIIIAFSLVGFILMDAFSGKSSLFSGDRSTTVGSVNGQKIDYREFEEAVKRTEQNMSQQGYGGGEMMRQQAIQQVWNQEVNRLVLQTEFEKLGLELGKKELNDVVYNNPPAQIVQQFTDPNTGQFNAVAYQQQIDYLKRSKNEAEIESFNSFIEGLSFERMNEKYNAMVVAGSYAPKWFIEKQNSENSQIASITYVQVPYTKITDSTIKVSDKEINDYVSKHKDEFKQNESRTIAYVTFSAAPTSKDSADLRNQLASEKEDFARTDNPAAFINQKGSAIPYFDGYVAKSQIQVPDADSILKLADNEVYGPYIDQSNYALAKMVGRMTLPDSVKCRHVLISTDVNQGGFEDSVAAQKIDSVKKAIEGGASWAAMVDQYNPQGDGSRQQNGEMTFSSTQIQSPGFAKEFAQYILFDGKTGQRKVVKTSFGYHYIEIMEQKGIEPHYKVAYLSKPINPSQETENNALNDATTFAGNSRSIESFNTNVEKELQPKGINKLLASVGPNDYNIMGLGTDRSFIRDIYKADRGEVLEPARIGLNYVVAIVTDITKEGTMDADRARPMVEPVLRNKKKAEELKTKIGTYSTLEEVATKMGEQVQTADSLRFTGGAPGIGYETKLIGASFDPANKGKLVTTPIVGNSGVYILRVDGISATAVAAANVEEQRKALRMRAQQQIMGYGYGGFSQGGGPSALLRQDAKIKDKRTDFY